MADEETPGQEPPRDVHLPAGAVPDGAAPSAGATGTDTSGLAGGADSEPAAGYLLPEQPDVAPDGRRRRRNRVAFAVVAGVLGLALLAVAAIIGFYAKSANDALNQVQRQQMLPLDVGRPPSPTATPGREAPVNVLIMGTDSRGAGDQGRSDVLMMAHISGDRKAVYLISFPRDLWVNVPGHGMAKINAAYAWGGMPLSVQTVEELTGARISHTAIVDFQGFVSAIDAIGGIEVYNFVASGTDGFKFPEGVIQLDGKSGLVYTRERYSLPNGDLDRARRQRDVVMAVVKKMLTPEVLADPVKFNEVVNTMAPYFTVDEGFTNAEMTKLALSMRITDGGGLRSLQAPILGFGTSDDGQSIDIVNTPVMTELGQALQNDAMQGFWEAHQYDPPVRDR